MTEIHLPGLLARQPAGALASFGLYALFPKATIRWERCLNTHYPVIQDGLAGLDHLKMVLLDPKTWRGINLPPTQPVLQDTQYCLSDYDVLFKEDPAIAQGLGCDQVLFEHKGKTCVGRTPFYGLSRQDKFAKQVGKLLKVLVKEQEKASRALIDPGWDMLPGPNFSMFPSVTPYRAYKSPAQLLMEKSSKDGKSMTAPLVMLLALAGLRLFPCYRIRGRKVLTTGWVESHPTRTNGVPEKYCWVYPVFNRHTSMTTALTWLLHPKLKSYRKHAALWEKAGVDSVYAVGFEKLPGKGCFMMLLAEQL